MRLHCLIITIHFYWDPTVPNRFMGNCQFRMSLYDLKEIMRCSSLELLTRIPRTRILGRILSRSFTISSLPSWGSFSEVSPFIFFVQIVQQLDIYHFCTRIFAVPYIYCIKFKTTSKRNFLSFFTSKFVSILQPREYGGFTS